MASSAQPPSIEPAKPKRRLTRRNPDQENGKSGYHIKRSSIYFGVARHRCTERYEAHLWDGKDQSPLRKKKGRQVYLGAYDDEEDAAHTYDLAALKYWGPNTILNFPFHTYAKQFEEMQHMGKEEYILALRRKSSGFSRGISIYRGVNRQHSNRRWEARINDTHTNKYLYLGSYNTPEEAAMAYEIAALGYRGLNALTNFDVNHYLGNHTLAPLEQPPLPDQLLFVEPQVNIETLIPAPQSQSPLVADPLVVTDPIGKNTPAAFCVNSKLNPVLVPTATVGSSSALPESLFDCMSFEDDMEILIREGVEESMTLNGIFEKSDVL